MITPLQLFKVQLISPKYNYLSNYRKLDTSFDWSRTCTIRDFKRRSENYTFCSGEKIGDIGAQLIWLLNTHCLLYAVIMNQSGQTQQHWSTRYICTKYPPWSWTLHPNWWYFRADYFLEHVKRSHFLQLHDEVHSEPPDFNAVQYRWSWKQVAKI